MSLLDLHVELATTNELLRRIADALDRAAPITQPVDHSKHPLIGLADVSRINLDRLHKVDAERATMPIRASERVLFSDKSAQPGTESGAASQPSASPSITGAWDHEDPLDSLQEFDSAWDNYPGGPV